MAPFTLSFRLHRFTPVAALLLLNPLFVRAAEKAADPIPVSVAVDPTTSLGPLRPIWRFFGADEPNYATMKDGRKLLQQLGELRPREVYFRTHNLLCSGDGTPALKWGSTNIYTEDATGKPIYNWTVVDHIFDTYLARGVRPLAQLGFMPEALSSAPAGTPYQHEWRPGLKYEKIITAWAYPPKDYDKWRELAYQWVKHCVERYSREEVEQWYWEIWNEANGAYWKGTPEEFQKMHDYAVDGIRRALPNAKVGGPHSAGSGGKFMDDFLAHITHGKNFATGSTGTPTDFIAFHAKGSPTFAEGHVRMGIANQLQVINNGFAKIAALPQLKNTPIIIGESDPDGCAACQGPQLGYRNGTMYSSYTAASFARKHDLADRHGVNLTGAVTWAFEFEDQPYFAGFRVLASNGIPLPVLNVFRMMSKLGNERIAATSDHALPLDEIMKAGVRGQPDIGALASRTGDKVSILLWHYHDDDLAGPPAEISVSLPPATGSRAVKRVTEYLVDQEHGNAYHVYQGAGSPIAPDEALYAQMVAASELTAVPAGETPTWDLKAHSLKLRLARQGVALLVLELGE